MLVHLVVFPKCIAEESLQHVVLVKATRVETVHEVGVVQQHTCRFLGEFVALAVNHVDKTGFFQIFDVVHHRCATHAEFLCQLADVGNTATARGEHIEKLLDFRQVFQLYLLDK